jgi:hypothetical protein
MKGPTVEIIIFFTLLIILVILTLSASAGPTAVIAPALVWGTTQKRKHHRRGSVGFSPRVLERTYNVDTGELVGRDAVIGINDTRR